MTERGPVLVTGAAGFIGSHIALHLVNSGYRVVGVDNAQSGSPFPKSFAQHVNYTHEICRATDGAVLNRIRSGEFVAVIHQAANSNTFEIDRSALHQNNFLPTVQLAEECRTSATKYIYASSGSVYGRIPRGHRSKPGDEERPAVSSGPLNLYAESKLAADRWMTALHTAPFEWIGLRYTNVFGTGESVKGKMSSIVYRFAREAAAQGEVSVFSDTLTAVRDLIPVDAVSRVIKSLIETRVTSGIYNLGTGVPFPLARVFELISAAFDGSLTLRLVPNPIAAKYQYWTCANIDPLMEATPAMQLGTVASLDEAISEVVTVLRDMRHARN